MYTQLIEFGTPAYDDTIQLRTQVLRDPLGLVFYVEDLEKEYNQYHLVCYSNHALLLGCLVLLEVDEKSLKMRQVAVDPSCQKKGIGKLLVAASEDFAVANGFKKMVLHARYVAVPFYEKLGYKKVGRPFTEVEIKHYKMTKDLKHR
ncbi:MAG: GNAT family N-acetyltransferase [Saprospiraceae bacterium]